MARIRATDRLGAPVVAVLGPGAIGEFRRLENSRGCEQGWFQRSSGGFVCGKYLTPAEGASTRVAPADDPSIVEGSLSFRVSRFGPRLFESSSKADAGNALLRLRKGSVIRAVGPPFRRNGQSFVRNRKGFFIEADRLEPLPAAEQSLGASFAPTEPLPQGIVTGAQAKVRAAPESDAPEIASLARWSWIPSHPAPTGPQIAAGSGWVRLPSGGYVEQTHVSRFREPIMPAALGPKERWVAIDLQEQLAAAYEGQNLVRLMPCSTGLKGNTPPGEYRIQHKRRLHTMRLRMGQIRVEDVPWVIFFDLKEALAIHTAYWHSDFGAPRSHGCVNLPEKDARWVYEWSWPVPAPEDSETMAFPASTGTRIIVFR